MESKLKEAIASQDWYSAHQLLISLGQRHQRARRYPESKALLSSGLSDMCPLEAVARAWPPLATVADIALKYVEVFVAATNNEDIALDDEEQSVAVFRVLLQACDGAKEADEKHAEVWADVSGRLLDASPALASPFFEVLLASSVPLDWKLSWCVEHMAGDKAAWGQLAAVLAEDVPCEAVLVATLHLLAQKAFGSASALLSAVLASMRARPGIAATPIDDSTGTLPSFLCFLDGPDARPLGLLNAAQVFYAICQRRSPPKILFTALRDRYKLEGEAAQLVEVLQRVYSPQPKKPAGGEGMNPLASMFQSMFSGGAGGPGGFPMMPPPPPQQRKPGKKNSGMDLD